MRRLLSLALIAFLAWPAAAEVIVHEYSGVITAVFDGQTGVSIDFPEFRVGDRFTVCFAYDTSAVDSSPQSDVGHYFSPANAFRYESAALTFSTTDVGSAVVLFPYAESVSLGGTSAILPPGWSSPDSLSDSFGVIFQNAPSNGVLLTDALPPEVFLTDWEDFRELRLDFFDGVTSPTATTTQRLSVRGQVDGLSLAPAGSPCGGSVADPVEALCPTTGAWRNHGEYVSCVAHATQDLVRDGDMTRDERQQRMKAAAQSDVGK